MWFCCRGHRPQRHHYCQTHTLICLWGQVWWSPVRCVLEGCTRKGRVCPRYLSPISAYPKDTTSEPITVSFRYVWMMWAIKPTDLCNWIWLHIRVLYRIWIWLHDNSITKNLYNVYIKNVHVITLWFTNTIIESLTFISDNVISTTYLNMSERVQI